ncbi:hypothetical protein C5167_002146 [Papaver somniferum]|uniref:WRKY domain-containing protein n=1 Tax=Papaver somniferum TaxID=3469 RepID=A0A4Y7L196_PAPSO|nr:probable WRKY transcription factor 70 [Papaver somniferum]RZC77965.1 hypothetical protein C5167_002146 [Papaver somniferum]
MEDLVRGQEFAKQVHLQLQGSEIPVSNEILDSVAKILECFANAISKFSSSESSSEVCHSPALTAVDSPFSDGRKLEGTGEIRTIATPKKTGSNKRRKTSDAREELTTTPFDDGRAWRKYGQKEIFNTKFPKSYFRCTHKTDQGCKAAKQVQRIGEEEPAMFRVLYIGQHTCNNQLKGPQLFLDSNPRHTCLLNFESNYYAPKVEFPFPASISSAKHEFNGDTEFASHKNRDSVKSSEFAVWNDLSAFNPSPTTSMMPSTSGSELVDGIAGLYSSADSNPNFVMDMMFDDDDVLQFDPNEFFNYS